MTVLWVVLSVAAVSVVSLIGVITLSLRGERLERLLPGLVALATGALLGGAFLHLVPESAEALTGTGAGIAIVVGLLVFFVLERFLHWHHHHHSHVDECPEDEECREEIKPFGKLILTADALHNMLDGAIIAGAYLVSVEAGVVATIAIALHEIPQEIGDFGVLLLAGFSRGRALLANLLTALSAFVGAGIVFLFAEGFTALSPVLAAFAAGGFIYIAAVDLVPELHRHSQRLRHALVHLALMVAGFATMYGLLFLEMD